MARALLVVDVQNDFCEGGSLAVAGGAAVAAAITRHASRHARDYVSIATTQDWHVDPGPHFAAQPDFVDTWPAHCVAGTTGAALHADLRVDADIAVRKGERAAAYSGFEGVTDEGASLLGALRERGVDAVDVCGIATDHCVRASALDAVAAGLRTRVLLPLCAGVAEATTAAALAAMRTAGVELVDGGA